VVSITLACVGSVRVSLQKALDFAIWAADDIQREASSRSIYTVSGPSTHSQYIYV